MGKNQRASVLFVCLGNICRSPMAEGALREAAFKNRLDIEVGSVGTAAYHIGEHPDPRAIATARAHNVDISLAVGQQLADADFERYTHIFAMDKSNLAAINARKPRHSTAQIGLLLDLLHNRVGEAVPDPYYGDDAGFEECWQTINEAVNALMLQFGARHAQAQAG